MPGVRLNLPLSDVITLLVDLGLVLHTSAICNYCPLHGFFSPVCVYVSFKGAWQSARAKTGARLKQERPGERKNIINEDKKKFPQPFVRGLVPKMRTNVEIMRIIFTHSTLRSVLVIVFSFPCILFPDCCVSN